MAWTGHAIEAACPLVDPETASARPTCCTTWPGRRTTRATNRGRYRDTRAFKSRLGNMFSMGMQYHIVHHLYPRIPLVLTPAAYRDLRPILEKRNCDLGEL